jgi:hypothetical protein
MKSLSIAIFAPVFAQSRARHIPALPMLFNFVFHAVLVGLKADGDLTTDVLLSSLGVYGPEFPLFDGINRDSEH